VGGESRLGISRTGLFALEKVEVAALICLENVVFEQACVAADRDVARRRRCVPFGEAPSEFGVLDKEVDPARRDIE
jgi:hypothetical protein